MGREREEREVGKEGKGMGAAQPRRHNLQERSTTIVVVRVVVCIAYKYSRAKVGRAVSSGVSKVVMGIVERNAESVSVVFLLRRRSTGLQHLFGQFKLDASLALSIGECLVGEQRGVSNDRRASVTQLMRDPFAV